MRPRRTDVKDERRVAYGARRLTSLRTRAPRGAKEMRKHDDG